MAFSRTDRVKPKRSLLATVQRWKDAEEVLATSKADEAHADQLQMILKDISIDTRARSQQTVGPEDKPEPAGWAKKLLVLMGITDTSALRCALQAEEVATRDPASSSLNLKVESIAKELPIDEEAVIKTPVGMVTSLEAKLGAVVKERDILGRDTAQERSKKAAFHTQRIALQQLASEATAMECEADPEWRGLVKYGPPVDETNIHEGTIFLNW
uniref:Uncharacterized protein n=1 Tax=Noctiluca scintillans TaxID=2966 RepID=A0A7S0ZT35_NOCSC